MNTGYPLMDIIFALYDEARELDSAYKNGMMSFIEYDQFKKEMGEFLTILLRGLSEYEKMWMLIYGKANGYFSDIRI